MSDHENEDWYLNEYSGPSEYQAAVQRLHKFVGSEKAWMASDDYNNMILAVVENKCYYADEWTDEVGTIPVCVTHGNNSKHDAGERGPNRPCVTVDPW